MKKHIGTVLIIIGIAVIAVPLIGRYMADRQQDAMMEEYLAQVNESVEASDIDALNANLEIGSEDDYQSELDIGIDEAVADALEFEENEGSNLSDAENIKQKPKAIGLLEIPKINVKLPVAEGTDLATLKFSLGHMPGTAGLGAVGNSVIAGHRSHSFGTYFNRLDEVEVGDVIYVNAGGQRYQYDVYSVRVVEPDDLSVLGTNEDHRIITLITCTPIYVSTHRLIVHGIINEDTLEE